MQNKLEINYGAATFPHRYGWDIAAKLGFTKQEWDKLWWLAFNRQSVIERKDDAFRKDLLLVIAKHPTEAARVISEIQKHENRKDNPVRSVLLAKQNGVPNYNLTNKEVVSLVLRKTNQPKLAGKALQRLIENVKKQRQGIAEKHPAKGKS